MNLWWACMSSPALVRRHVGRRVVGRHIQVNSPFSPYSAA